MTKLQPILLSSKFGQNETKELHLVSSETCEHMSSYTCEHVLATRARTCFLHVRARYLFVRARLLFKNVRPGQSHQVWLTTVLPRKNFFGVKFFLGGAPGCIYDMPFWRKIAIRKQKMTFGPKYQNFGVKIWQKIYLLGHLKALPSHLVPCWSVGWWLWRAGYISQDTYLLYMFYMDKK